MTGFIPKAELEKAACLAKVVSPSMQHAVNRAWLIASANRCRMAVYRCRICSGLHVSSKLDGEDTLFIAVAAWTSRAE